MNCKAIVGVVLGFAIAVSAMGCGQDAPTGRVKDSSIGTAKELPTPGPPGGAPPPSSKKAGQGAPSAQ